MNSDQHDTAHHFFQMFTKVLYIFSILIIVFGIFIKAHSSNQTEKNVFLKETPSPKPQVTPTSKFNLVSPSKCGIKTQTASISASIQSRMIHMVSTSQFNSTHYLVRGDCLYIWKTGIFNGSKICGIESFVSWGETLINLPSDSFINSLIQQAGVQRLIPLSMKEMQSIAASCKRSQPLSLSIFEVPKHILFKSEEW